MLGNDNLRKVKERLLTSGFLRRLKLVYSAWSVKKISVADIEDTNIIFTPNLPEDKQLQVDMATAIQGIASNETVAEMLSDVTGIDAKTELERKRDEANEAIKNSYEIADNLTDQQKAGVSGGEEE